MDIEISPILNEEPSNEKQDFTKEDLIESHDIGGDVTDTESDEEEEIEKSDTKLTKNIKDQQR